MKWWDWMPWSYFSDCWALSQLFPLSSFTFIKTLYSSSSLSAIKVVSSVYLRLLIFLQQSWFQLVLHRAWHVPWCTPHKLNKQGDNIQPWHTPFPIWNQSVVTHPVLTVASWPAYIFLSNFQVYNAVLLTRVTVLYIVSPWLIFFISLYLLIPFTHFCENLWFWFHDLRETLLMIRSVWISG